MKRIKWDVEELVALIDVYHRNKLINSEKLNDDLQMLSKALNKRADVLGIDHDEKYRNLNGMYMMYQNVVFIATKGHQGLSSASRSLQIVYEMSLNNPEVFALILSEFNKKYKN